MSRLPKDEISSQHSSHQGTIRTDNWPTIATATTALHIPLLKHPPIPLSVVVIVDRQGSRSEDGRGIRDLQPPLYHESFLTLRASARIERFPRGESLYINYLNKKTCGFWWVRILKCVALLRTLFFRRSDQATFSTFYLLPPLRRLFSIHFYMWVCQNKSDLRPQLAIARKLVCRLEGAHHDQRLCTIRSETSPG